MKKKLLMKVAVIGLIVAPVVQAHDCCDHKLDALSKTVLNLTTGAHEIDTELTSFIDTCCTDRGGYRAPSCSCETTPITAAGALSATGAYCLAQDITGDIDATVVQVKINLNGHKVTGNVTMGSNSYVYGGTIRGTLTVGSNCCVEDVQVDSLVGLSASSVLVKNSTLPLATTLTGFESIAFDALHVTGDLTLELTKEIIVHNAQLEGALVAEDGYLEKFALYDSQITGTSTFIVDEKLTHFGIWQSSLQNCSLGIDPTATPSSVISTHNSSFKKLTLATIGLYSDIDQLFTVGIIDSCACEQLQLSRMKNIRVQDTVMQTHDGVAVEVTDCQQITLDHVNAASEAATAFSVVGGKNMFLKQCNGFSKTSSAFECGSGVATLENLNLLECSAKNSVTGFLFNTTETTGTVIRCVADFCDTGFSAAQPSSIVFVGNVSVGNTTPYQPEAIFNPSNDPTTAVSWRNMTAGFPAP